METQNVDAVQEYEIPIYVNEGEEALVYRISDDKVAKVTKFSKTGAERLKKESKLAEQLYMDGFPVPIPYGIHKVRVEEGEDVEEGFIMEFIPGKVCDVLSREEEDYVTQEVSRISEEAIARGYIPFDLGFKNTILTPNRTVKLIDFSLWEYNGEKISS